MLREAVANVRVNPSEGWAGVPKVEVVLPALPVLNQGGLLLGALTGTCYDQAEVSLRPRDRLVLFADGTSEAVNPAR